MRDVAVWPASTAENPSGQEVGHDSSSPKAPPCQPPPDVTLYCISYASLDFCVTSRTNQSSQHCEYAPPGWLEDVRGCERVVVRSAVG